MYTVHEALSHECTEEHRRRSARNRLSNEVAASRRWRRRAERARRAVEGHDGAVEAARRDYDLAGR